MRDGGNDAIPPCAATNMTPPIDKPLAGMLTLVLLPGMDGTGELFADFAAALGARCHPVIVAYPMDKPLTYQALEDLVRARLPTGEPFVLLAESFSGPVAIALAAEHPPGLAGLILCCTFARNPIPSLAGLKAVVGLLPIWTSLIPLLHPWLLGRFSLPRLKTALGTAVQKVAPDVFRTRLREVLQIDYCGRLRQVNVPTLYLRAQQDRLLPASIVTQFAHVERLEICDLAGPHLLLQTQPQATAAAILEFIEKSIHTTASNREPASA